VYDVLIADLANFLPGMKFMLAELG